MKLSALIILLCCMLPVQAAIDVYDFNNGQQKELYEQMITELRCLVCQNQNLSASNASLAKDLRQQTYAMVMRGQTHDQIVNYMTQRYGDFVLYRPPLRSSTFLLWFGPFILLAFGLATLLVSVLKRKQSELDDRNDLAEKGGC